MNTFTNFLAHTNYGHKLGYGVIEDNQIAPVFYHGKHFLRFVEGYYVFNPLTEIVGPPIYLKTYSGVFKVKQLHTSDCLTFDWPFLVQFFCDPRKANKTVQSRFTKLLEPVLLSIVQTRLEQILRAEVAKYTALELHKPRTKKIIEFHVWIGLVKRLSHLGFTFNDYDVIALELTFSETFQQYVQRDIVFQQIKTALTADGELSHADMMLLVNCLVSTNSQGGVTPLSQTTEKLWEAHKLQQLMPHSKLNTKNVSKQGGENISTSVSAD